MSKGGKVVPGDIDSGIDRIRRVVFHLELSRFLPMATFRRLRGASRCRTAQTVITLGVFETFFHSRRGNDGNRFWLMEPRRTAAVELSPAKRGRL